MNSSATEIFATALEFEGDSRTGFIADSCGGDTELRAEVEAMLADAARADDFSATPPTVSWDPSIPSRPSPRNPAMSSAPRNSAKNKYPFT